MDSAEKSGARAESGNAGVNTAGSKRAASPRERIVRSAAKLFLEKGYDKVSINDIIDTVGGSKGTIYSHFGSKEKLFEAVVEQMCADVTIHIDTRPIGTIEEQLTRIGHTFVSNVVSPSILRFHRLMTSIGRDFPAAGRLFYDTGPRQAQKMIGDWIALHQRAGNVRDDVDPYRLAVIFHDMLIGEQHLSWLTSAVSDKERNKRIDETVRLSVTIFLQGCARR